MPIRRTKDDEAGVRNRHLHIRVSDLELQRLKERAGNRAVGAFLIGQALEPRIRDGALDQVALRELFAIRRGLRGVSDGDGSTGLEDVVKRLDAYLDGVT